MNHRRIRLTVLSVIGVVLFAFYIISFVRLKLEKYNLESGLKAYNEKRYYVAFSFFSKAAEYGSAEAQFMLGESYYNGYGVDENLLEAYKWYCMAEKNNHKGARERIVCCFIDPDNLIIDKKEALEICGRCAEDGFRDAQYKLGLLLEQDSEQVYAFKWFKRAAQQGHPGAQYKIGECYEYAKGIGKNYSQACYWYEKAAKQGFKVADQALARANLAKTNDKKVASKKRDKDRASSSKSDSWNTLSSNQEDNFLIVIDYLEYDLIIPDRTNK